MHEWKVHTGNGGLLTSNDQTFNQNSNEIYVRYRMTVTHTVGVGSGCFAAHQLR